VAASAADILFIQLAYISRTAMLEYAYIGIFAARMHSLGVLKRIGAGRGISPSPEFFISSGNATFYYIFMHNACDIDNSATH